MLPDLSKEITTKHGGPPKILIIEDNAEFRQLLSRYVQLVKCEPVAAPDPERAYELLEEARKEEEAFSAAMIDLRFEVGRGENVSQVLRGIEVLQYIKVEYPEVACLIISGESIEPSEVLDLRDYYGLDYYLAKDRLDPQKLAKAIARSAERIRVAANERKAQARQTAATDISPRDLREILDQFFNEEELLDLCFDLNVDYESLGGTGKRGKSRELINTARRHGRFYDLVESCQRARPFAFKS
ncbi:MAG: response regulator [Ardenticatenaceae bacterium]|nr:response regulator [Anaerolineales bacterium]MCB8989099.1 response regulator [Ardenticatenaceae bacterium]